MSARTGAALVFLAAAAVFANSLGNGFAFDDTTIVERSEVVRSGDVGAAVSQPYWPGASAGTGLYRPLTVASFAVEWQLFGGSPRGFHLLNVLGHALVATLVFWLLLSWTRVAPALFGALVFALHPVHTEAVANVVGRAELYAAGFYLMACLLYLRGSAWGPGGRSARLLAIAALGFLSVASKEIGITLPAALVLLETARVSPRPLRERLSAEVPVYLVAAVAGIAYLLVRTWVLGTLVGEVTASELRGLGTGPRLLTALSLWPQYLRLLLFPLDLVADYAPGVLFPSLTWDVPSGVGLIVLIGLSVLTAYTWGRNRAVALGVAWFALALSPVSQLFFSTGTLLAERTLYLPSVGLAFVAAGVAVTVAQSSRSTSRVVGAMGVAVLALLSSRTVLRNPSWASSFTVFNTLAMEHPESGLAMRSRGTGLIEVGEIERGEELHEMAIRLQPEDYQLLTEVGASYGERERWAAGERVLLEALRVGPDQPTAYRLLAGQLLRQGRALEAHRLALAGLSRVGSDRELWALVSESYLLKQDFPAAIRARQAALGVDPESREDWARLAAIHVAAGDTLAAERAQSRADIPLGSEPL